MDGREIDRMMVRAATPVAGRPALDALLALDARLGSVLRATREPMVGQMRLTWWHGALVALDTAPPPAEPILTDIAATLLPAGIGGVELATMIDGWEALLDDRPNEELLATFAAGRGGGLFAFAARVLGAADGGIVAAGEGWALADLARHHSDPRVAAMAERMAAERFDRGFATAWSRRARPLGAMALLAWMDIAAESPPPGSPARAARLVWHRLTGR